MTAPANLNTADRLIRQALRDAGRLQTGQTPSSEVLADCLTRMYDIINVWQTQGIKLWLNQVLPITLVADQSTYILGPSGTLIALKPTRALEGWYVRTDGTRRPLNLIAQSEHYALPTSTSSGSVVSFMVEKRTTDLNLKIWNAPSAAEVAAGSLEILIQRQAVSPTELDENVALPIEWYMALRWSLADDLAGGQHALIMERCANKARTYTKILEDWDVEDASVRFAPQMQGHGPSRFR